MEKSKKNCQLSWMCLTGRCLYKDVHILIPTICEDIWAEELYRLDQVRDTEMSLSKMG